MNWREDKPTNKQLEFIKDIYETLDCEPFEGSTKGEACDWITAHREQYDASCKEMREWSKLHGEYVSIIHENAGDRV